MTSSHSSSSGSGDRQAGDAGSRALAVALLAFVAIVLLLGVLASSRPGPLLLAPMMGLDACLFADRPEEAARSPAIARECQGAQASAAPIIESTLRALGERRTSRDGTLEMGYTLNLPLLKFLTLQQGQWTVDQEAVGRAVRSVRDADRPVVLYLFSTHFGSAAPAEAALAQDADNLLQTPEGPLGKDRYYQTDIYPWSFVRLDNGITRARESVVRALLQGVCGLPQAARERVRGVTLLGELHQMFPRFEDGMGFSGPYVTTDYSAASVQGFRQFLRQRFGTVERLNAQLGAGFRSFDELAPPSRDIRSQPLRHYWEHIDAYAAGTLPVMGWLHAPGRGAADAPWVRVYLDGSLAGRVQARFGRQDVLAARPEFKTADLGWRFDLAYAGLPPGMHRLDIYMEEGGLLARLDTRHIAIMDRAQTAPQALPSRPLPVAAPVPPGVEFHVDAPAELSSYYFNPLVPLWNAFRARQVRDYLDHFRAVVAGSCVPPERIYSHQILPFVNPGWDVSKFAVEQDLDVPARLGLGVSLYGEASYGASFFDWLRHSGRDFYGVTEFHPLRAMSPDQLKAVLRRHAEHGARFLSFFAEAQGSGPWCEGVSNVMSFDAANPHHGSAPLRAAVQAMMQ